MTDETLCLFKSSRRTEYTQENLRILSGATGSRVEVAYKERWLGESVRARLPKAGDPVLIALADPPYTKSHPIRRAEVVRAEYENDTLRLTLSLGARVKADGKERWRTSVESGEHPKAGKFAVHLDIEEGVLEDVVDPERELKVWKKQVDAACHGEGYARVAFLRVQRVAEVGEVPIEPPYRLISGRTYQVDVLAFNPHLDGETLDDLRLVPVLQPSLAEVETDAQAIPADGELQVLLVPRAVGPALLESSVSRGAEFWDALWFEWQTVPPPPAPQPVEAPEPASAEEEAEHAVEISQAAPPALHDGFGSHLFAAYELLRGHHPVDPDLRLSVLDEMLQGAPGLERLQEQRGIVLHELRRWPEAAQVLGRLTPGALSAEGRTMLVSAWFMQSRVPEPLERIKIADFSHEDRFQLLLEASGRLTIAEQVEVARLLASTVLAEDRASRWITPLATNESLSRRDRLDLLVIWKDADPAAAAAALDGLVVDGVVELADPEMARLALEVALEARRPSLARRAAFALMALHAERKDVPALEALLQTVMARFAREDRSSVGEDIITTIADVADEEAQIEAALAAAAELVEDRRQRGELDSAAQLGKVIHANEHRAGKRIRHQVRDVMERLDEAMDRSKTVRKFEQARRRELGEDIKDFVGGQRVLVVGATDQVWWPDLRQEFGFDPSSEWVATEKRKSLSSEKLAKKLGKVDLLVIQKSRISHKISEPLEDAAKAQGIKIVWPERPTREAFTQAIRIGLIDVAPSGKAAMRAGAVDDLLG